MSLINFIFASIIIGVAAGQTDTLPTITFTIIEELPSGYPVGNIAEKSRQYLDTTKYSSLIYIFQSRTEAQTLFSINDSTGNIFTSVVIDRETVCDFKVLCLLEFNVIVRELEGPFAQIITVQIFVEDKNDNSPLFQREMYPLTISEGVHNGSTFGLDTAVDKDRGDNNSIQSYKLLTDSDYNNTFGLNVTKNKYNMFIVKLVVQKILDRETKDSYIVKIAAVDGGTSARSGTLTITVNIEDINDNPPKFTKDIYNIAINETTPIKNTILTLSATDKDMGDNAEVSYHINQYQNGKDEINRLFSVEETTGELKVNADLKSVAGETFRFIVEAMDHGDEPLVTQAEVIINIKDSVNDPPVVTAVLTVVIATITFMPCDGFLMDTDCPAPPPCTCDSRGINCRSKGLISVPIFRVTSARMTHTTRVILSTNVISTIQNGAFSNLGAFINGNNIFMYLSGNHLNDAGFSAGAFNGVTDTVTSLDISNNNLTTIPAAVGQLHNLVAFDVLTNPIATVDYTLMQTLGHSLHSLLISIPNVNAWPVAFYNLRILRYFIIYDFKHTIPHDAFRSVQSSLYSLQLYNFEHADLPNLACGLEHLTGITVSGNMSYKSDANMPCQKPLSAVKSLQFTDTTLNEFPDVFNLFPNLNSLYIDKSLIRDMDICKLPPNITLTEFWLSDSRLTLFPEMVNDFKSLTECHLNGNMITSLGRHSIRNLPDLYKLRLDGNPLDFVSKCAFLNLPKLTVVDLHGTHLTTIPSALRLLPNLLYANMTNNPVACDCHLHWTNQWDRRIDVTFGWSYCHNLSNMTLNDFINTNITQCQ